MSDPKNAVPRPLHHSLNDIERARRAREETEIERALAARMAHYDRWNAEQSAQVPKAQLALSRLLNAALHGTGDGQSEICRDFLLGLCSGHEYPFDLARLRRLEIEQWQDCMAVLQLHQYSMSPLHLAIQDGEQIWQRLRPLQQASDD